MISANLRNLFLYLLLAVVGGLTGILTFNNRDRFTGGPLLDLNWPAVAAILGAAAMIILYFLWKKQPRPFTIIALALIFIVLGLAIVGPVYLLFTTVSTALVLFASTLPLRDLYAVNTLQAFGCHMRVWLAAKGPSVTVKEGKITEPTSTGPHFGPRSVTVHPGNAVVLTKGSSVSRVCGPSTFVCRSLEYVSRVLPISKVRRNLVVANVLSFDELPVEVHISYICGINISDDTNSGKNAHLEWKDKSKGLTESERDRLLRIVNSSPDWEQDVQSGLEGAVHNEIGGYDYSVLLTLTNYRHIAQRIMTLIRPSMQQLGVDLCSVSVTSIAPRVEVIDALTEGERIRTRHAAEGEGLRRAISAIAVGYEAAMARGMTPDDIYREVGRQVMEQVNQDLGAKTMLPSRP